MSDFTMDPEEIQKEEEEREKRREERKQEILPADEYNVIIKNVEVVEQEGTFNDDGNPKYDYFKIQYGVIDKGQYENWVIFDILSKSPKARWRMNWVFKATGLYPPGTKEKMSFDHTDLVGQILVVKTKHETSEKYGTQVRASAFKMHPDIKEKLGVDFVTKEQTVEVTATNKEDSSTEEKKGLSKKRISI
tara:strand:- start:81 stop:653 length:573 start_codon:yes stop_codon:yes gene_type:complete